MLYLRMATHYIHQKECILKIGITTDNPSYETHFNVSIHSSSVMFLVELFYTRNVYITQPSIPVWFYENGLR